MSRVEMCSPPPPALADSESTASAVWNTSVRSSGLCPLRPPSSTSPPLLVLLVLLVLPALVSLVSDPSDPARREEENLQGAEPAAHYARALPAAPRARASRRRHRLPGPRF